MPDTVLLQYISSELTDGGDGYEVVGAGLLAVPSVTGQVCVKKLRTFGLPPDVVPLTEPVFPPGSLLSHSSLPQLDCQLLQTASPLPPQVVDSRGNLQPATVVLWPQAWQALVAYLFVLPVSMG